MLTIKYLTKSFYLTSKGYGECYFLHIKKKISISEDIQSSLKVGWHSREWVAVGSIYIDKMLTFGWLGQRLGFQGVVMNWELCFRTKWAVLSECISRSWSSVKFSIITEKSNNTRASARRLRKYSVVNPPKTGKASHVSS